MTDQPADGKWLVRERYWRRKLGRIRLGVEPIEEQVTKYRRATWVLTWVLIGLAAIFVGLFAAFQRPDIGGVLAGVLLLPIVILAWAEFALTKARVARYLREMRAEAARQADSGRT